MWFRWGLRVLWIDLHGDGHEMSQDLVLTDLPCAGRALATGSDWCPCSERLSGSFLVPEKQVLLSLPKAPNYCVSHACPRQRIKQAYVNQESLRSGLRLGCIPLLLWCIVSSPYSACTILLVLTLQILGRIPNLISLVRIRLMNPRHQPFGTPSSDKE